MELQESKSYIIPEEHVRGLLLDFLSKQEYCGLVEILEDEFEWTVDSYLKSLFPINITK